MTRQMQSKHARVLRDLGFKEVPTLKPTPPSILAALKRLDCGMFVPIGGYTYVTDELGKDWELDSVVDLEPFDLIPVQKLNEEPEFAGQEAKTVTIKVFPK